MWNWHDLGVLVPHVRLQLLHFQVVVRTWASFWEITTVSLFQLEMMKAIQLWQKRKKLSQVRNRGRRKDAAKTLEIWGQFFRSLCRRPSFLAHFCRVVTSILNQRSLNTMANSRQFWYPVFSLDKRLSLRLRLRLRLSLDTLTDRLVQWIYRNINCALGKRSLEVKLNLEVHWVCMDKFPLRPIICLWVFQE